MTIDWLFERMEQQGDHAAIVWQDQCISYAEMLRLTRRWAAWLPEQGIGAGTVVAIQGDYSPQACALLLALVEQGAICVPLSKAVQAQSEEFQEIAEVSHVITFDGTDGWRLDRRDATVSHPLLRRLVDEGAPGLVVFSSGSTGKSKASVHDFLPLLEKFKAVRQRLVMLTFLQFDHLGGINTLFYALSNGGTVVTTQSRDPEEVCRLIEQYRVQLLPVSPTFLNLLLLSGAYRNYDMTSLQLITYGTEVMPESTLQRLAAAFPDVRLQQTYGLSELGVLRTKSKASESLWVKVGGEGVETKVVDGQLWIRSQSTMLGYLNAANPVDADGWMNTQDEVEVDGEYIRILGRRSEIINVGGNKVYPAEVESALLQISNIRDAVVFPEPNAITGQVVVARVNLAEPEDPLELLRRVRAELRDKLPRFKIPVRMIVGEQSLFNDRFKRIRRENSHASLAR